MYKLNFQEVHELKRVLANQCVYFLLPICWAFSGSSDIATSCCGLYVHATECECLNFWEYTLSLFFEKVGVRINRRVWIITVYMHADICFLSVCISIALCSNTYLSSLMCISSSTIWLYINSYGLYLAYFIILQWLKDAFLQCRWLGEIAAISGISTKRYKWRLAYIWWV